MTPQNENVIDLAGSWRFALDPNDEGHAAEWFSPHSTALNSHCTLPGSVQEQGFGHDVTPDTKWTADRNGNDKFDVDPKYAPYRVEGNTKFPYWLQPLKYYAGLAWFARDVTMPDDWRGRRVVLHLERPHWQTTVWVDGVIVGPPCDSLSTPHEYDLTTVLTPGPHTITLCVDNRLIHEVGPNAHSVSDHTQGNWNGVVGRVELRALPSTRLAAISIVPDLAGRQLHLTANIESDTPGRGRIECCGVADDVEWQKTGQVVLNVSIDGLPLWSEHSPTLVETEVVLLGESGRELDRRVVRHGVREITTDGTQILFNGVPTLLRGTLECCIFPRTGYPPTTVEPWRRIMTIVKQHGLNHVRFHSWCPPEAAFDAADEVGIYLQVECAAWPNQGATIGDGRSLDAWLYAEAHRIISAYGHHPSFVMLACGNEPAGDRHVEFLSEWITYWKARDPQRLHTGGAGWPVNAEGDFHVRFQPRLQHWGAGLTSPINSQDLDSRPDYRQQIQDVDKPTVTHEIGQWCAYPDLAAIVKYDGTYRATSFEIVRDSLRANGLDHLAHDFLIASGKLQALAYKEEIEAQLRTPGLGGFQLLDLHDFPGQGTALVGVLDAFWDSKGYITPEEFRRFCGPAILLARIEKRVLATDGVFEAGIELSYFAGTPVQSYPVRWRIETHDRVLVAAGIFDGPTVRPGDLAAVGRISFPLDQINAPLALRLVVEAPGVAPANDWDFWVYDPADDVDAGVLVTDAVDDAFVAATTSGRPVLLCPPAKAIASPVALGFSPIFWNTLFTNGQAPHTLGLLIDEKHPAMSHFPTSSHSDWQWQEPIRHAACLMLDRLGEKHPHRAIIRVIDDWNENRSLALLVEVRVGQSRVLISGVDLAGDLTDRPVSRQLRKSLVAHLVGTPQRESDDVLTIDDLRRLLPGRQATSQSTDDKSQSSYGSL